GALLAAAGAPAAMYLQYADPSSAFNLNYSVSVLAMALIGGTSHWMGPVLGAILLGSTQQYLAGTISSEVNVLVLGIMLVLFVVAAPKGIIGLVGKSLRSGDRAWRRRTLRRHRCCASRRWPRASVALSRWTT